MLRMRPTPVPRAYTPPLLPPQIGRAVAMLRSHRDLRIAQRANAVVAAWRDVATVALQGAEAVLSSLPKSYRGGAGKY